MSRNCDDLDPIDLRRSRIVPLAPRDVRDAMTIFRRAASERSHPALRTANGPRVEAVVGEADAEFRYGTHHANRLQSVLYCPVNRDQLRRWHKTSGCRIGVRYGVFVLDLFRAGAAAVWVLVVPGLPVSLYLMRRHGVIVLALALSPLVSVVLNLVLLCSLNVCGIYPNLRVYAAALALGTVVATWRVCRGRVSALVLRRLGLAVAAPVAVAGVVWVMAYHGFRLASPNYDGLRHTFWIRRIIETGSVLGLDFHVEDPQAHVVDGSLVGVSEFVTSLMSYPQAWHTSIAAGAALTDAPVSMAAFLSTLSFWTVVLALGLIAFSRLWVQSVFLGSLAAMIAQVLPQVPGSPMSWGSMTSVIGISMLPGVVALWIFAARSRDLRFWCLALVAPIGLALVHPSEAAAAVLIGGACVAVERMQRRHWASGVTVLMATVGGFLLLLPILRALAPGAIATLSTTSATLPVRIALHDFFTLGINTGAGQVVGGDDRWLMIFVIAGIACAIVARAPMYPLVAMIIVTFIFLASVLPNQFFQQFRPYTYPWWTSYERTAWDAAPFFALFAAYPAAIALRCHHRWRGPASVAAGIAVFLLAGGAVARGFQPTVAFLHQTVDANQAPRPGADIVWNAAAARLRPGGLIITPPWEGALYSYTDAGLPVTNGANAGSANRDAVVSSVLSNPPVVCTDPYIARTLAQQRMPLMILGDRGMGWVGQIRTREQIVGYGGWSVVAEGGGLYLMQLALERCAD